MIKLKDLLIEGSTMTPQEKKRTISRLHKFDEPQLTDMLRTAADAANRGNARADDLAHIYRDELNSRNKMGEGTRIDEGAPSPMIIANTLDTIRWHMRGRHPEFEKWLKPQLRKIENAARKWERSGG